MPILNIVWKSNLIAVIAVANKLIRQAFAVATQEKPYVDGYVSFYRISAPAIDIIEFWRVS